MNMQQYLPGPSLRNFIKHYLIITSDQEMINNVLPDTALVMSFRFKGMISYETDHKITGLPATVISGLRKTRRIIHYAKDTGNFIVVFKETGAHAFIKEPLHELAGESLPLSELHSCKDLSVVEEQLNTANSHGQMITIVETYLLAHLHTPAPDLLVLTALEKIHHAHGLVRIKALADSLYISQDAFEKRFRKAAGMPAKQFCYLVRMRAIVNGDLSISLPEMAFNAGYFDQPHFNKDFKLFTGQSPKDFLKDPRFW